MKRRQRQSITAVLVLALLAGGGFAGWTSRDHVDDGDAIIAEAFAQQRYDVQVAGSGRVARLLPDDNNGSRHQRFILELRSGQTVLVAHNIDLADRVASLRVGDHVDFYGEYEYNDRGGVIHWTHRDPRGSHPHGWLEHAGQRYW